jgi:hypothetical protein
MEIVLTALAGGAGAVLSWLKILILVIHFLVRRSLDPAPHKASFLLENKGVLSTGYGAFLGGIFCSGFSKIICTFTRLSLFNQGNFFEKAFDPHADQQHCPRYSEELRKRQRLYEE